MAMAADEPEYLRPYARAAQRHGGAFRALLWASQRTQAKRFEAIFRLQNPSGLHVLDVGCGRADLLEFFIAEEAAPSRYTGIEAVEELHTAALARRRAGDKIIRADFIRQPQRMNIGADIVICSGSLNTLQSEDFYNTLRVTFAAARVALVFNFLCSPLLAGTNYLYWHDRREVLGFAKSLGAAVREIGGYIDGDLTFSLQKLSKASE